MKMASKIGMFGLMAAAMMVVGCSKSTKSEGSMGATSEKATCGEGKTEGCCKEKAAGSMGATSEKATCGEAKSCTEKAAAGSMGATSEKKAGCCSGAAKVN